MRTLLTTLHSKYIHPSLALPCLAAYCRQSCGELLIREYTVHQPKENLLARIVACTSDVICFSVYIWNRQVTLELATALKKIDPQLRVVLGGPEISFERATFFESCPVDAIICGEGEKPLRHLLKAWQEGRLPESFPGLQLPGQNSADVDHSLLEPLDELPSPFSADLVDLRRGYVYYESSRGCPYSCSFCMSALDEKVRSFSMARIRQDLSLLMQQEVAQIKFVDRTFNYHAGRSYEIFSHILQHNRSSHFHFEIGADLLDERTLQLLESVPPGMFQFEIGVQTTSTVTLGRIGRNVSLARLEENVRRLLAMGNIHLHLDLIAGLPGESISDFFASLRSVFALRPHHLQVELVKLLPGSPLRFQAAERGLLFDPAPPYTVLRTPELNFAELERLRGIGRLLDLVGNSERFEHFLRAADAIFVDRVELFDRLQSWWQCQGLFDEPLSLAQQFDELNRFVELFDDSRYLREGLARDFALSGRVVPGKAPTFFNCKLTIDERQRVKQRVKQEIDLLQPQEKLQHFAAIFETLTDEKQRRLILYFYRNRSGASPVIEEVML